MKRVATSNKFDNSFSKLIYAIGVVFASSSSSPSQGNRANTRLTRAQRTKILPRRLPENIEETPAPRLRFFPSCPLPAGMISKTSNIITSGEPRREKELQPFFGREGDQGVQERLSLDCRPGSRGAFSIKHSRGRRIVTQAFLPRGASRMEPGDHPGVVCRKPAQGNRQEPLVANDFL